MGIAEDGSDTGGLISNAILRRSSFKSEGFATHRLFSLPATACVVSSDVVEPLREGWDLVGFIPWMVTDVVSSSRAGTPHLIVRQHQESVAIVATLLFGSLLGRRSTSHAMNSTAMVHTSRIGVAVAISKVGHESSLVSECLVEGARANRHFVSEIPQETIHSQPVVAEGARPVEPVSTFPLWAEVPSEGNRFGPENAVNIEN